MATKILIIDDHAETVQLIELALRRQGYDVTSALSGVEGLRVAEELQPHLILLDVMMPEMDGFAVLRKIRSHERLNALPVIMFTARAQPLDKLEGLEAGANDYLVKPTQTGELINRIEGLLARGEKPMRGEEGSPTQTEARSKEGSMVLVIGARGGAGATQTAINLAASLSTEREPVTLVDLDARQGHIALYLERNVQREASDWLRLPVSAMREELEQFLIAYGSELPEGSQIDLMLSRPHIYSPLIGVPGRKFQAMVRILRDRGGCTVVDIGQPLADNVEPLLQAASWIIICLSPERPAIIGARSQITALRRLVRNPNMIQLLMLDYGAGKSLPRASVEKYLGQPLTGVIPITRRQLAGAVDSSQPLVTLYPECEAAVHFRKLADAVVVPPGS